MSTKTSIVTLLILSALLLTGCNLHFGTGCRASQADGDRIRTTGEQQDGAEQSIQLREDLQDANERARLAEEKAESERQKRKFAEERLRRLENPDQEGDPVDSPADRDTGGS
ncbi:MAG TPA: hypothetical protein VF791_18085 [Pyrinomonadaceae bacterium]